MIELHHAARVHIAHRGTRIVGDAVERARPLSKIDDRVQFPLSPYVRRSASQIGRRSDPVFPKLSLNGEVPGVSRSCLPIRVHDEEVSAGIKLRIVVLAGDIRSRERISTGIVLPWIIKTTDRKSKSNAGSPRRRPVAAVNRARDHVL